MEEEDGGGGWKTIVEENDGGSLETQRVKAGHRNVSTSPATVPMILNF